MTEPGDLVSPDDTGSDTFARFKYQAHATFPFCLRLARGDGITDVFAEHVEDIAVRDGGTWRFLQVKSRDAGRGPWTFAEVARSGAFQSLWRAYGAAGASVEATYEVCLEGAVKNDDVLSTVVESGELDEDSLQKLASHLGASFEEVERFAVRLHVRSLPPRESIRADNLFFLGNAARGVPFDALERSYDEAVAAIEAAMTADRLDGNWPAALFLAPDERSQKRLEAKRIGREHAERIFGPILRAASSSPVVPPPRAPRVVLPLTNLNAFTGRASELRQLELLLLRSEGEKVSSIAGVSGSGGIGKSALACRFAELHQSEFPDGVIGLRVDGREAIAIAREFANRAGVEIDAEDQRDASTLMQEIFRDRRALLIFDNADDVAIRALLPGGTRCAVIVTTRDRALPLALGVPEAARLDLSPLPPAEALELLSRLVGAAVAADEAAANRICELVGYLPLALQIAGAAIPLRWWRTLRDYADALAEERKRLAMLSFEDLDVRASFSLSLQLLERERVEFFASLSVCAQDGFSLMAAAAANGCDEPAAEECLTQLYRLSLVNGTSGDVPRFVLHPLLRLFAREKAEELGLRAAAETRHREHYAALVKGRTRTGKEAEKVTLLGREIDDIVAAAESMARDGVPDYEFVIGLVPYFQRHGSWEKAARIFEAFLHAAEQVHDWSRVAQLRLQQAKFLTLRGQWIEAEKILTTVETVVERVEPPELRFRIEAMVLNSLGGVFQRRGRFEEARRVFERSHQLLVAVGDESGQAMVLNSLGGVLQRLGDFGAAADCLRQGVAVEQKTGNLRGQAISLNSLGSLLQRQGAFAEAADMFRRSAAIDESLHNFRGEAMTMNSLGGVLQRQGDFEGALAALRRSEELVTAIGDVPGQAKVLNSIGGVLQRQGKFDEAAKAFRRSHELERELGNERGVAMVLNSLGGVLQRQGKFDEAVESFRRSHAISEKLEDQRSVAMVLNSLGGVLQRQGKFDEAVDAFRMSYGISSKLEDQRMVAMVLNSLGGVLQRQGKFDEAVESFRRSHAISEKLEDQRSVAMVLNSLGGVLQRQGKFDEAAEAFRRSHAISSKLEDQHMVAMVLNSLGGVLQRQGKFEEAVAAFRRSYELLVELSDLRGQAMVLNSLGGVLQRRGKFDEAEEAFRTSYAISEKLEDQRSVAMVLNSLGGVLQRQGKLDEAIVALRTSFELEKKLRDLRGQAMVLNSLGGVLGRQGKLDEASDAFRESIAIGEKLDDRRHLAMAHTAFGRLLLRNDREAAVRELRAGFEFDAALRNRKGVGIVAPLLVETLIKLGRIAEAREICERALTLVPRDPRLLRLKADLDRRPS